MEREIDIRRSVAGIIYDRELSIHAKEDTA